MLGVHESPKAQLSPEVQRTGSVLKASRKRARPSMPAQRPQLWSDGANGMPSQSVPLGSAHQATLPPLLVPSIRPPPAPPPCCWCGEPAVWQRRRWWCAAEACGFEARPCHGH